MKPPDKVPFAVLRSVYKHGQRRVRANDTNTAKDYARAVLAVLRWNMDHYFFNYAGMYVGIETNGYMHT